MMRLQFWAAAALLVAFAGCESGARYAPVSGVVKINGKPYGKAVVRFQPMGGTDNPNPGQGSAAYTDENGRYVLQSDDLNNGAVVGKHLVRIMTKGANVVGADPTQTSPDGPAPRRDIDPIPPEWNSQSQQTFDVPPSGTDKADFDIQSKYAPK
ncbi:MAG TPA: hypothetical protein VKH44_06450 [Pirellulaceae bacterium]|nr:hypothetical protein [Pirellulaceae bacterium]